MVATEEIEDLDGAREIPFAGSGLEGEPVALQGLAQLGHRARRLLRQADAQPFHGAVHPGRILAAAVLGADLLFAIVIRRVAGRVGLGGGDRFAQVLVDAL